MNWLAPVVRRAARVLLYPLLALSALALAAPALAAQASENAGGEANLRIPDLSTVSFFGIPGHRLLMVGLVFCALGMLFGLVIYGNLKRLPVHRSMREVSELIYETCKTYLVQQGKFLLLLELFIGVVILLYFGVLQHLARPRSSSFCCSVCWASPAATAWRGSASA